jgi:hypothetical protein
MGLAHLSSTGWTRLQGAICRALVSQMRRTTFLHRSLVMPERSSPQQFSLGGLCLATAGAIEPKYLTATDPPSGIAWRLIACPLRLPAAAIVAIHITLTRRAANRRNKRWHLPCSTAPIQFLQAGRGS